MRKVLVVPSLDLSAIDMAKITADLKKGSFEAELCERETEFEHCVVLVILGQSNNPALAIPFGKIARENNVPIAYVSLPCKYVVRVIKRALATSRRRR